MATKNLSKKASPKLKWYLISFNNRAITWVKAVSKNQARIVLSKKINVQRDKNFEIASQEAERRSQEPTKAKI